MTRHDDDLETAVQLAYARSLDAVIGFPCDLCGEQIEGHERMVLVQDGEEHQQRVHERCVIDAEHHCSRCSSRWPAPGSPEPGASSGEEA